MASAMSRHADSVQAAAKRGDIRWLLTNGAGSGSSSGGSSKGMYTSNSMDIIAWCAVRQSELDDEGTHQAGPQPEQVAIALLRRGYLPQVPRALVTAGKPKSAMRFADTAARFAAERGNLRILAELARWQPSILSAADRSGMTPLHYAAEAGEVGAMQALVAMGASPRAVDSQGRTPLVTLITSPNLTDVHAAAGMHHLMLYSAWREQDVVAGVHTAKGPRNPILAAMKHCKLNCLRLLLAMSPNSALLSVLDENICKALDVTAPEASRPGAKKKDKKQMRKKRSKRSPSSVAIRSILSAMSGLEAEALEDLDRLCLLQRQWHARESDLTEGKALTKPLSVARRARAGASGAASGTIGVVESNEKLLEEMGKLNGALDEVLRGAEEANKAFLQAKKAWQALEASGDDAILQVARAMAETGPDVDSAHAATAAAAAAAFGVASSASSPTVASTPTASTASSGPHSAVVSEVILATRRLLTHAAAATDLDNGLTYPSSPPPEPGCRGEVISFSASGGVAAMGAARMARRVAEGAATPSSASGAMPTAAHAGQGDVEMGAASPGWPAFAFPPQPICSTFWNSDPDCTMETNMPGSAVASFSSVSPFETAGRVRHGGALGHAVGTGPAAANRHPGKLRYGHSPMARRTSSVRGCGLDTIGAGISITSPSLWLHVLSSSTSLHPACRPALSSPSSPLSTGTDGAGSTSGSLSRSSFVPTAMDILGRPVLSVEAAETWLEDMRSALTATLKTKSAKHIVSVSSQVAGQAEDDPVIVARQMLPWDSGVVDTIYDASRRRIFSSNDLSRSDSMAMAHADTKLDGLASAVKVLFRKAKLAVTARAKADAAAAAAGSVSPTTTLEVPLPSLERSRTTAGDDDDDDDDDDDETAADATAGGGVGDGVSGGTDSDTDDEGIFAGTPADLPSRAAVFGTGAAAASAPAPAQRRRQFVGVPYPSDLSPEQCCLRWRPLASTAARILPSHFFGILDARPFFTGRMASLAGMRDPLAEETTPAAIPDGSYILPQVKLACLAVMRCLLLNTVAHGQQAASSSKAAATAAEAEAAGIAGATAAELAVLSKLVEDDGDSKSGADRKATAASKRASRRAKQKLKKLHDSVSDAVQEPTTPASITEVTVSAAESLSKPSVPDATTSKVATSLRTPVEPAVSIAAAGEWKVVGGVRGRKKPTGADASQPATDHAGSAHAGGGKSVGRRAKSRAHGAQKNTSIDGSPTAARKGGKGRERRQINAHTAGATSGVGGDVGSSHGVEQEAVPLPSVLSLRSGQTIPIRTQQSTVKTKPVMSWASRVMQKPGSTKDTAPTVPVPVVKTSVSAKSSKSEAVAEPKTVAVAEPMTEAVAEPKAVAVAEPKTTIAAQAPSLPVAGSVMYAGPRSMPMPMPQPYPLMRSLAATHERMDHLNRTLEHHQQMMMMMMNPQWSQPPAHRQPPSAAASAGAGGVIGNGYHGQYLHTAAMQRPQAPEYAATASSPAPTIAPASSPPDSVSRLGQLRTQLFSRFERAQVLGLEPHHVIGRGLSKLSGAQHDGLVDVLQQLLDAAKSARDAARGISAQDSHTVQSGLAGSATVIKSVKPRGTRNKTIWSRKQTSDAAAQATHSDKSSATSAQATGAQAISAQAISAQATGAQAISAQAISAQATSAQATEAQATSPQATGAQATGAQAISAQATEAQATEAQATGAQATEAQATGASSAGPRDPKLGRFKPYAASSMPMVAGTVAWGDEADDEDMV